MLILRRALVVNILFILVFGLLFPTAVYLIAQAAFPFQANGSLLYDSQGKLIGSALIGQQFTQAKYFHPRPSVAGAGYDAANTSGTNLGPTSAKLIAGKPDDPATADADESFAGIKDLAKAYRQENSLPESAVIPADAATHSSSGLDPDISPANAALQAGRVAQARSIPLETVNDLIKRGTEGRFLGIFGEPRVNVLKLNLALDKIR